MSHKNKSQGNMYPFVDATWNPIRGICPHQCSYCVGKETLIMLPDLSSIPISELDIGDEILGINKASKYYRLVPARIEEIKKRVADTIEVVTENTSVRCSEDHEWLIHRNRWRSYESRMIKPGQRIRKVASIEMPTNQSERYKMGYLRGIIFGDGTIGKYRTKEQNITRNGKSCRYGPTTAYKFRLTMKDEEALVRTKKYLKEFGIDVFDHIHMGLPSIRRDGKDNYYKILETIKPKSDKVFLAGYLGGMFDAEGSYSKGGLRIHNQKIKELSKALYAWKFDHHIAEKESCKTITIRGGLKEQYRFIMVANPAIKRKRTQYNTALKHTGYDKIKKITKRGKEELFDIQTSTGNFIANGLVSHNCYMRRLWTTETFNTPPRIIEESFKTQFSPEERIFVGSSIDIFAAEIPKEWISRVLDFCRKADRTGFLFQTKNPGRFREFRISPNFMIAATIETNRYSRKAMGDAPAPAFRAVAMQDIQVKAKMISIEPIMKFDEDLMMDWITAADPVFVSIGADSKGHGLPEPTAEEVESLIKAIEAAGIEVVRKDNLTRITEGK